MARPSEKVLTLLLDVAIADLTAIRKVVPHVYDHAHRNDSFPCRSIECQQPPSNERPPEPVDKQTIRFMLDTLRRIAILRQQLASRLPALEAQQRGKKLSLEAPLGSRPVGDNACIVCGQVPDKIQRGMCRDDYNAYRRAGRPDINTFVAQRRLELEQAQHQDF